MDKSIALDATKKIYQNLDELNNDLSGFMIHLEEFHAKQIQNSIDEAKLQHDGFHTLSLGGHRRWTIIKSNRMFETKITIEFKEIK
jgi:hypothetical protein